MIEIRSGAVFIADSHINSFERLHFIDYLLKLNPPQVFLMGDIFNLFIPHIRSSLNAHKEHILALNKLSARSETFYFFGNHDFGINSSIFPNIRIYPRALQPAYFRIYHNKRSFKVALSHGDFFISTLYSLYINFMNSPLALSLLKLADLLSAGKIYDKIELSLAQKHIKSMRPAISFINARLQKYLKFNSSIDIVIEGHFHSDFRRLYLDVPRSQGPKVTKETKEKSPEASYLPLPSLKCQKSFVTYLDGAFYEMKYEQN